jgi:hypothetical protein
MPVDEGFSEGRHVMAVKVALQFLNELLLLAQANIAIQQQGKIRRTRRRTVLEGQAHTCSIECQAPLVR